MQDNPFRLQRRLRHCAVVSTSSIALLLAGSALAETAIPSVEGPIPETEASTIFTTGGTDLEAHGYEIEEYLVSGTANVYDWGADGTASEPQIATADALDATFSLLQVNRAGTTIPVGEPVAPAMEVETFLSDRGRC